MKREFYVSKTETNLVPTMFKKSMYAHGEIPTWNTKYIEIPYMVNHRTSIYNLYITIMYI